MNRAIYNNISFHERAFSCNMHIMETTLYIVRHGETEWNRLGLLQGSLNSSLTTEGILNAENLRPEITELNPDVIYSSDQERAYDTAQILSKDLDKNITQHPGLQEMNFGVFQGHNWDYIENEMKEIYEAYRADDPDYAVPGGESHNQFHERIVETIDEITMANLGKKILIVSHGGSINKMLCHAEDMAPSGNRYFLTKNLGVNILKYNDGKYKLTTPVELIDFAKAVTP